MRPVLLALLLGVVSSITVASQPQSVPSELEWHTLPQKADPWLGSLPSLTTDDGQTIRLRSVTVRAVVVPPIASTELELTFDEIPGEGAMFSIDLPASAGIRRFAVHDEGRWHDAEPIAPADAPSLFKAERPLYEPFGAFFDKPRTFNTRVIRQAGQAPRLLLG